MDWRVKGAMQKALGVVPGGEWLHYRLQRRFGGLRQFEKELETKVDDWRIMVRRLSDAGMPIAGIDLLEVGTGWYPTFPFACYLGGARRIETVDLNRHLKPDLVRACLTGLRRHVPEIARLCDVDERAVVERYEAMSSKLSGACDLEAISAGAIRYRAPGDATRTGLPAASIDCIFSNSVLEHVPPDAIDAMYGESMRILRPGGVMFHSVNCGDHYAYVDSRISQLNYLKFSDRAWRFWNNAFLYQNRLRANEFVDRAVAAGFGIDLDTGRPHERRLAELASIDIDPMFLAIERERLCITSVDLIARKPRVDMPIERAGRPGAGTLREPEMATSP